MKIDYDVLLTKDLEKEIIAKSQQNEINNITNINSSNTNGDNNQISGEF